MAVLIVCDPMDVHVAAVAHALEIYGIHSLQWHPAPPWARPGAVHLESRSVDYHFLADGGEINPSSVDAVWMRRWPRPTVPASFRESDEKASRNELRQYHGGVLELLPTSILWANPLANRIAASYKLRQLAVAASIGLLIPKTVVTDDAAKARDFVRSHAGRNVVYKPFHTFHWQRREGVVHSVTTQVTEADLDDPESLIWSPGIFQSFVPKAYELRVSVFGRTCVSAKIFDQDPVDWRTRQHDMRVVPYRLPGVIEHKLHTLMDELGLAMGMVDLIVTPDGDYVFLEVNEQGQFLWVEEHCPDLPLLDIAARFFASGDPHFKVEVVPSCGPTFAGFMEEHYDEFSQRMQDFLNAGGKSSSSLWLKDYDKRTETVDDPDRLN